MGKRAGECATLHVECPLNFALCTPGITNSGNHKLQIWHVTQQSATTLIGLTE
jgi:hypothetical protein